MEQNGFGLLSRRMQAGIASTLGWRSLRPVQNQTIQAILSSKNCLVIAPTAGGKTEAAFFPILDLIYSKGIQGVAALYISPIRALLNNQEPRLSRLSGLVGLSVFKWHGDVSATERKSFLETPSSVLMTTPESLEVMLISSKIDKPHLFSELQFVVIDEIHHFASDDRGAHLMAVLERLNHYSKVDLQRIGLSATVGNPKMILDWMQGSSQRDQLLIQPPGDAIARMIRIDSYEDTKELSAKVGPLVEGRKTLFFVEGRNLAEGVKQAIQKVSPLSYVHHSSVGRELREEAEQSFMQGHASQCIICTSTMELGIDVGDLDAILQLDAPLSVSSFMQRMGRTGRRPGTRAEMNLFCGNEIALLRAIALVNLARQGWIEPIQPSSFAIHILTHQILAQSLQFYGIRREKAWQSVRSANCFATIQRNEFDHLVDHLVSSGILHSVDGLLIMGAEGEKRFGRKNFLELYSVFETPEDIHVVTTDQRKIGTLQAWFVQNIAEQDPFVFTLAGQAWLVRHVDFIHNELVVVPAPQGAIPRWNSGNGFISRQIAEEMRNILAATEKYPFVTAQAGKVLESNRRQWEDLVGPEKLPIRQHGKEWHLYTFAGDRNNLLLSNILYQEMGLSASGDSLSLRIKLTDSPVDLKQSILQLLAKTQDGEYFSDEPLTRLCSRIARGRYSKFQSLLPPELESRFLVNKLFDIPDYQEWVRNLFS